MDSAFSQIFNTINIGLVILDRDGTVTTWNRWMELSSGVPAAKIVGAKPLDVFPALNTPRFTRNFKTTLTFGSFSYFSQKLHGHLFTFSPNSVTEAGFEFMQQNCSMGPIRDSSGTITAVFLTVQDVTEVAAYEKKLIAMNMTDGLTGLDNRKAFDKKLAAEIERSRRSGYPFSLVVLDVDHFKRVNDLHGHHNGDQVLKGVASRLAGVVRKTDILARYGGEEFGCLMPDTNQKQAVICAERMRQAVEREPFLVGDKEFPITISLGVCQLREFMAEPRELFTVTDVALYEAKNQGRNKTCEVPW